MLANGIVERVKPIAEGPFRIFGHCPIALGRVGVHNIDGIPDDVDLANLQARRISNFLPALQPRKFGAYNGCRLFENDRIDRLDDREKVPITDNDRIGVGLEASQRRVEGLIFE
ncbi:hypothetical protein D3C77_384830 [compost metagenome]